MSLALDARAWRRFHAIATLTWIVLLVPSLLWWKHSILWVILLSVWANIVGHGSAWQAARAEVMADPELPVPGHPDG